MEKKKKKAPVKLELGQLQKSAWTTQLKASSFLHEHKNLSIFLIAKQEDWSYIYSKVIFKGLLKYTSRWHTSYERNKGGTEENL